MRAGWRRRIGLAAVVLTAAAVGAWFLSGRGGAEAVKAAEAAGLRVIKNGRRWPLVPDAVRDWLPPRWVPVSASNSGVVGSWRESPRGGRLAGLVAALPPLRQVSLPEAGLDDADVRRIVAAHPGLEYVRLDGNLVGRDGAERLLGLPRLKRLSLEDNRLGDADLAALADGPKGRLVAPLVAGRLAALLDGGEAANGVRARFADSWGDSRKPVVRLVISADGDPPGLPEDAARLLEALPWADHLAVRNVAVDWGRMRVRTPSLACGATPDSIDFAAGLPGLKTLRLWDATDAALENLRSETLESLIVSGRAGTVLKAEFLGRPGRLPRLRSLNVEGNPPAEPDWRPVSADLSGWSSLESLRLEAVPLDGASVRSARLSPGRGSGTVPRGLFLRAMPFATAEDAAAARRATKERETERP